MDETICLPWIIEKSEIKDERNFKQMKKLERK